jgi:hypothetical protein
MTPAKEVTTSTAWEVVTATYSGKCARKSAGTCTMPPPIPKRLAKKPMKKFQAVVRRALKAYM